MPKSIRYRKLGISREKVVLLDMKYSLENFPIDEIVINPRRSDVSIKSCTLVWKDAENQY